MTKLIQYLIFAGAVVAVTLGANYLITTKSLPLINKKPVTEVPSENKEPVAVQTQEKPKTDGLSTYTNLAIKGLTFKYDPKVWNIEQLKTDAPTKISGKSYYAPGMLLKNINDGGVLHLAFNLPFGVGGGLSTFSNYKALKNSWGRITVGNASYYGDYKKLVFYKSNKKESDAIKTFCDELTSGKDQMYPILDETQCKDFYNNKLAGHAPQPLFTRSASFALTVPLKNLNPMWDGDAYIKSEGLDDGKILVEATYSGTAPEGADFIVEQLIPLSF